ncbi:MAG: formate/nitrite transporter family protein [Anaerovoracaceae bacterium]
MDKNFLAPAEIAAVSIEVGKKKSVTSTLNLFVLGILAGAFIAFAAEGSNMAAYNLFANPATYGLGKALAGAIFGTGLMLVVVAGGELFTGNCLIIMGVLEKHVKVSAMFRNWGIVYLGNFVGSIFIAYMMSASGLFESSAGLLGAMTIKIAAYKVGLSFSQAFFLGIMCNWLVCLAVWMAYGAKDIAGKLLAVFFPIWLFITSGFEHSVANMYYIPAGIFAKANSEFSAAALDLGLTADKLSHLGWQSFFVNNLLPVTLGNIVGGGIFVGMVYWFVYIRKSRAQSPHQ